MRAAMPRLRTASANRTARSRQAPHPPIQSLNGRLRALIFARLIVDLFEHSAVQVFEERDRVGRFAPHNGARPIMKLTYWVRVLEGSQRAEIDPVVVGVAKWIGLSGKGDIEHGPLGPIKFNLTYALDDQHI